MHQHWFSSPFLRAIRTNSDLVLPLLLFAFFLEKLLSVGIKMMALVIAMVMTLSMMSVVAFASEDPVDPPAATGKSITLTGGKAGHTYTLYQIFTGEVKTVDGVEKLTNLQWGSDANATYKAAYDTAAAAALEITTDNDARATAQSLVANSYLGTGTPLTLSADGNVEFTGLAEGYYLIVDSGNSTTTAVEGDYDSAYIVEVVKDVTGKIKGSGATSDKTVTDAETGNAATDDAAAYNIGDAVPFQLSATTADNVAAYKKYHITFQDKQSSGLDAPTTFTVTVLGKTFTVPAEELILLLRQQITELRSLSQKPLLTLETLLRSR